MKYFKILLGIIIALAGLSEFFSVYRELGGLDFAIIAATITLLGIGFLLIRSGVKTNRYRGHKNKIISFLFVLTYLILLIIALGLLKNVIINYYKPIHFTETFDGNKIPLDYCIRGHKKRNYNSKEIKTFCECMVLKLYDKYQNDSAMLSKIKTGKKLDRILKSMDHDDIKLSGIPNCYNLLNKYKWSKKFEQTIKEKLRSEIEIILDSENYNLDQYCDCIIEHLKTKKIGEITNEDYYKSTEYILIDSICTEKSIKKY